MALPNVSTVIRSKTKIGKTSVPTVAIIGGVVVAGAVTFLALTSQGLIPDPLGIFKGGALKVVQTAADVQFDVQPDQVRPNSFTTLVGRFVDEQNRTVAVKEGWYYVFEDIGINARELKLSGSLGQNVSTFKQNLPTTAFRSGTYSVRIIDRPLTPAEIGPLSSGPNLFGSGIQATGPTQGIVPGSGRATLS